MTFQTDDRKIADLENIDLRERLLTGGSSASDVNFSPEVTMSPSLSNMITQFKMDSCQLYEDRGQVSPVCILLRTDHYCESSLPSAA